MKPIPVLLALTMIVGCQHGGGMIASADSQPEPAIVTASEPAVFARTQGQFSRAARDYLYLGPVAITDDGATEYFWWIGIASTIDRDYLAADRLDPGLLILEIDGAPVEFDLGSWEERLPGLDGRKVYDSVVPEARILAARVTRDQIEQVSASLPDRIRLARDDGTSLEYTAWKDPPDWPAFTD